MLDLYHTRKRQVSMLSAQFKALSFLGALQFATEAAITILRIDDMIKIEKGPEDEEMD